MIPQVDFSPSEPVRAVLSGIGRTEDLRFSPDNRLLAIAGYGRRRCLILRIQIELTTDGPRVAADDFMELTSDGIGEVHGLDFIDNQTLVVANRDGVVALVPLPPGELGGRQCHVKPTRYVRGSLVCRVRAPGSVAAMPGRNGDVHLLVCNNYVHRVTRHVLDSRSGYRVRRNHVLLERGLTIPDGLVVSHDGRWIAVSSHGTHDVKMFSTSAPLGRKAEPAGILRNANYPHGLRFTLDDRHILVADAGSPVILVYDREAGWDGARDPARSVAVLDDETFLRGRATPEEGGPKGLDIDRSNNVVAVTCHEQPLAFFSLASVTGVQQQESSDAGEAAGDAGLLTAEQPGGRGP
jgi:DNA-binding beta-propeller fold protein YncE